MLGEAALTAADAERYLRAYEHAIHAIGKASAAGAASSTGPASRSSCRRCTRATPRPARARDGASCCRAWCRWRGWRGATTSASTSTPRRPTGSTSRSTCWRRSASSPALAGWDGLGFVVQAYQKRTPAVIDCLVDLARRSRHRLMVRLVKGAYWDSEIKRAQVDGLDGYPVYTRKAHTDVSYLACARKLLAAPDAVYPAVRHPQRADRWRRST